MRALLLFLVPLSIFSQQGVDTLEQRSREATKTTFAHKLNQFEHSLTGKYPKRITGELIKNITEFKESFSKGIDRGKYIYETPLNAKVEEIYKHICDHNPQVPKDLQVLVSRDISLNASCLANGTLVVNSGAVHYLESEAQLAGIICHEIAHKLLNHSENALVNKATEKYGKESKRLTKEIKRKKYNKREEAFSLVKERLFSISKENRRFEFEADSVGFMLLKNTNYNPSEFLKTLSLSMVYDTVAPPPVNKEVYRKLFDIPNQPFQEDWLKMEDFSRYDYVFEDKISSDSISSHPEMDRRIKKLQRDFPELSSANQDSPNPEDEAYENLRLIAKKNQASHLYALENYGLRVYLCMIRIDQGFLEDDHKQWLGKAFYRLHGARKNYTANKYLDRVSPDEQSAAYQQFLNFMWNLRLTEMENISAYYNTGN